MIQWLSEIAPVVVVGAAKSPLVPIVGATALAIGVLDNGQSWVSVAAIGGGGALLILGWFANAVKNIIQRTIEAQGQKLLDLPEAASLRADHKSLTDKLLEFAEAAEAERKEMQAFRITLATTLENHSVRLGAIELICSRRHEKG